MSDGVVDIARLVKHASPGKPVKKVRELTKCVAAFVRVNTCTSYGSQWNMHHAPMLSIKHISNPGRLSRPHLPQINLPTH
jgi:hypothetical protein